MPVEEPPPPRLKSDVGSAPAPTDRVRGTDRGWWPVVVVALALVVSSAVTASAPKPAHGQRATPRIDASEPGKSSPLRLAAARVRSLLPLARMITLVIIVGLGFAGGGAFAVEGNSYPVLRFGLGFCAAVVVWGLGFGWMYKVRLKWHGSDWSSRVQHLVLGVALAGSLIAAGGSVMKCANVCQLPLQAGDHQQLLVTPVLSALLGALSAAFYRANGLASRLPDPRVAATVRVQVWGYLGAVAALTALFLVRPAEVNISNPLISAAIGGVSFGAIAFAVRASEAVAQ